jgi:diaminopimelate epimerase
MIVEKYNANGNDFLITHRFKRDDFSKDAIEICSRQSGVGADGLIVIIPHNEFEFEWLFYNSDGSEAEMCGNGSRATAHYAYSNGLAPSEMKFLTGAGVIGCQVEDRVVTTDLTPPFIVNKKIEEFGKEWWLINTGVPHLVATLDDISSFSIEEARELRYKYNANVNISKVENDKLYVRTYERGVEDETLACGTGMAACFYKAHKSGLLGSESDVFPKSGEKLYLATKGNTLIFRGEVQRTFFTEFLTKKER